MTGQVILAVALMSVLVIGCVLAVLDVWAECEFQTKQAEHEELLDELWDDRDLAESA